MTKKKATKPTQRPKWPRRYLRGDKELGFKQGEKWVLFSSENGGVYVDAHCNVHLGTRQIEQLIEWLEAAKQSLKGGGK